MRQCVSSGHIFTLSDLSWSENPCKRGNRGGRAGPLALTTPDSTISTPSSAKRPSCDIDQKSSNNNATNDTTIMPHRPSPHVNMSTTSGHHHVSSVSIFTRLGTTRLVSAPACRAPAPPVAPAAAPPPADSKRAAPAAEPESRRAVFRVVVWRSFLTKKIMG